MIGYIPVRLNPVTFERSMPTVDKHRTRSISTDSSGFRINIQTLAKYTLRGAALQTFFTAHLSILRAT